MQPQGAWPPRYEPFARTVARNIAIACCAGIVLALARHEPALIPSNSLLALWFSLGGHYVEVLFLNQIRSRLPKAALVQRLTRLVAWFVGGAILSLLMAATARLLALRAPVASHWWAGGVAFIGLELFVHAILAWRRIPNFYRADG